MLFVVRVIAKRTLREFWNRYPDSERALSGWYSLVEQAEWSTPAQIRESFPDASFASGNRVVFNIRGNRFRLVAWINYRWRAVYVKWVGTHAEYDRIDVEQVGL